MPSPSLNVIDPQSDRSREELARLVKVYEFPSFVKEAQLDETMYPSRVAVTTYADPVNSRFPCHSAAATWLSGLYFQEKRAEYHPTEAQKIEQRLQGFSDYFRIRRAYDQMCKKAAELRNGHDLPDTAFAYVWVDGNGHKERHLPMTTGAEVKAAADWLETYRDRLPFQDRHTIATKILEKAAHFGALTDNTEFLEKQAGRGVCDPQEVYAMVMQRAMLTKSPTHKEQIVKLAATVKDKPRAALQPQQLVKLAVCMDMTDRALSLTDRYTDVIQRPEDVIFKVTFTKAASDRAELCALTSGNVYSREQFEKLSRDDVVSLFGNDFASEVCTGMSVDAEKMAEVAHTLPRPDAELLDRLMADSGLVPQMAKAGVDGGHGLSNEELEQLAAAYEVPA